MRLLSLSYMDPHDLLLLSLHAIIHFYKIFTFIKELIKNQLYLDNGNKYFRKFAIKSQVFFK